MSALLELRSVSKSFGSTKALSEFDFDLQPGEVHALLGENGAGKSTALGLIYGVLAPDTGEVRVAGEPRRFRNPAEARRAGIGCVFQELSLAKGIAVAENIYAGHPPARFGLIDHSAMRRGAGEALTALGVAVDVDAPVGQLPVSLQQIVEIAKALTSGSRILLLDEPTSALAPVEVGALHALIRSLKARGIGIIYVSHHLPEVFAIADRLTVLRDGRRVSTRPVADTSPAQVIAEMTGGLLVRQAAKTMRQPGAVILSVKDLSVGRNVPLLSLELRAGEITALAGLMGSGARDLALAIAGLVPGARGQVAIRGQSVRAGNARAAQRAGVWFVPEERKSDGLFIDFDVAANVVAATLRRFQRNGLLDRRAQADEAERAIARFAIKTPSATTGVAKLSGGNQQKVMLSRWLATAPSVLIVNEPTKGVDVGSKAQIHRFLDKCAEAGAAVLVVSSDFTEVLSMADRIVVVSGGAIVDEVPGDIDLEGLMQAVSASKMASAA